MKAKEYAKMCDGLTLESEIDILVKKMQSVWSLFMEETMELMKLRGEGGIYGTLSELDNKWKSICKKVDFLDEKMFRTKMVEHSPNLKQLMMWSDVKTSGYSPSVKIGDKNES